MSAADRSRESFTETLRMLLERFRELNRALRGHDPYTPEPPPCDPDNAERLDDPRWC